MKHPHILPLAALLGCATLTSCFKDEPLNAECDIEQAWIHAANPQEVFFQTADSLIDVLPSESELTFKVRSQANLTSLAPQFRITQGATISPASGTPQDFTSGPVGYRVTSEDGQYHRDYRVGVEVQSRTVSDTLCYDFEQYALTDGQNGGQFYVWTDPATDGTQLANWATGNPGFNLAKASAAADEYPTVPLKEGYDGAAARLVTRSTGAWGVMVNRRIAAGNLFMGKFDVTKALTATLKTTQFGLPFTNDLPPVSFTGFYQYTPGETLQDKSGKAISGQQDRGQIYAILYRNTDAAGQSVMLYGDDVLSNPNIVAKAMVSTDGVGPTSGWTPFEATFLYTTDISDEVLQAGGYNLAIVFSSSINGDQFQGAVGSELLVDRVRVVCAKTE